MAPFLLSAGPPERFTPFFEMRETQHAFVFRADLPGFEAKDLTVTLAANRLTIAGERAPDAEDPAAIYFARERDHCAFSRSFTLTSGFDTELALHAELARGVLTLVVPKLTELRSLEAQLEAAGGASN